MHYFFSCVFYFSMPLSVYPTDSAGLSDKVRHHSGFNLFIVSQVVRLPHILVVSSGVYSFN